MINTAAIAEGFYALGYSAFILLVLILMKKPNWWLSFIAGVVASIPYLTRAEGFLLMPLGFLVLLVSWWRGRHSFTSILISLLLYLAGWLVLAFPYLLFLRENLGGWTLSGKITQNVERVSEAIYVGEFESIRDDTPLHQYESPGLIQYLVNNLPRVMERYVGFTFAAFKTAMMKAGPLLLLFLWYMYTGLRNKASKGWHFLVFAMPLFVYPLAHIEIRYLVPTIVALVPLIAWGMRRTLIPSGIVDKSLVIRRGLAVLTMVMLAAGFFIYLDKLETPPYEHRILADWMSENLDDASDARIVDVFPYVNFYLDNENFRYVPKKDTVEEIIDDMEALHVDYFVVSESITMNSRPQLEILLNPENAPDSLELVVELSEPDVPSQILLYRLTESVPL